MNQASIAKECAEWINKKVEMKSFKKSVFNFDYENLKEWLENDK